MNWVGGTLSRLRGRDDKKIQREFFEKKRYEKTLDTIPIGMQSPTKEKELAISQDLLSLHTVLQTHSETNNRLYKQFKHPNMLDLRPKAGLKRTISFDLMQEPVLNEKFHTRTEGFQDLETPTSLLDVKKWRGEYKQSKTLGMSKAALCLRQFQEQEQAVFQREGVEEYGKENIPILGGKEMQEGVGEREEIVKERDNCMQWNNRVCEESDEVPGNSKWLEFLYGANKANTKSVSDKQPADLIMQHTSVQAHPNTNLSDLSKQSTAHMEVCDTEDLMEFEREKMIRRYPGQSEDPFYLTLTSNRDSFKGYKRPRIDSINSCSSGSSVVNTVRDRMGGFLEESVFATPTDDCILRSDGMLTENPLPYAYRSGMRSIKDFIASKTSKYDKLHDAITDEELEELDSSGEDSDSMQASNNIPAVIPTKSKFVVPFVMKEESPILLSPPKEEKQKSYDRFLQSLVAPNTDSVSSKENEECETKAREDIPQLSNDNKMDSLMMPILKWKEKGATEDTYSKNVSNTIESIPAACDECCRQNDKESNSTTEHVCDEKSIVIKNVNIEEKSASAHVEADLYMKETDFVENDENSADLMSGNNTEDSTNELMEESVAVRLEDANNIPEVQEMNLTECNDELLEVINGSLDVIMVYHGSRGSDNLKEIVASPTQFETETLLVREEANESIIEEPKEMNTLESAEIVNNETETNKIELTNYVQIEPEEEVTCKPQEQDELVVIRDNIIQSTKQIEFTQESEQIIVDTSNNEIEHIETITACIREESSKLKLEYSTSDAGVQYSQQSNGESAEENGVECRLVTESKECQTGLEVMERECQTGLEVMERECQTASLATDRECQTDIEYSNSIESKEVKSQEIQTVEEIISRTEEKLTSQDIQTEEVTHNNNGNQTDILLFQFPIETNEQNKYEQHEYENFILYQQQVIKALQKELEWSNL